MLKCTDYSDILNSMITSWKHKIRRINRPDYKILALAMISFVCILFLFVGLSPQSSPAGRYLFHTWRSVKKFSNIIYPLSWPFAKSELPEYRIVISPDHWKTMEDNLPISDDLTYGYLSENNKSYVSAEFIDPKTGYQSPIKIRYRGVTYDNWQAEKKSLRIKFSKDDFFQGMSGLNLIIPDDRGYFLEPLNNYRAKKLGLFAPDFKFVHIYINNRDFGVYLSAEPWSSPLMARNNIIDTNNIFSNKDIPGEVDNDKLAFSDWKSYIAKNEDGPFEELDVLKRLTNEATDEQFNRTISDLVDLNKVYRWQLINVLAGSAHQSYFSNFVLMFKKETGKFEPLPWDVAFEPLKDKIYDDNLPLLIRRIFKNKKYSDEFATVLNSYLNDGKNLNDDLAYYNGLFEKTKSDFYKDNAKNSTNFNFIKDVNSGRELIINNFEKAKNLLADGKTQVTIWEKQNHKKRVEFSGSFGYLNDISLGIKEFTARNPDFKQVSDNTLVLGPGTFIFSKTTIIPQNLKLIIEPATNLYFYPKKSLISYSSVDAIGTSDAPIIFASAFNNTEPWGSFGVINTGHDKNHFKYMSVNGGSTDTINGVFFTSQFNLDNADSVVENSTFKNGKSDDGLHAILGSIEIKNSLFADNSSDGIDLDMVKNSKIIGNTFYNSNLEKNGTDGDAIDLSGAQNLEILDNYVRSFQDKCISVGEGADGVLIRNNILSSCNYGIAIKDNSYAMIDNDIIIGNRTSGLSLYRKKQAFIKGGRAEMINSVLWGNLKEILIDETSYVPSKSGVLKQIVKAGTSQLSVKDSTIEGGYEGVNISSFRPNFKLILPAFIYNSVKLE